MLKKWVSTILLVYLRFLAKLQLKKYAPDTIGITGTAGKTSTLEAVAAVLQDKYTLKVSRKANSAWGIPVNILGMKPLQGRFFLLDWLRIIVLAPVKLLTYWQPHEKYLVEMGVDGPDWPNNMDALLDIIQPRTAIFLNVDPMHSEPFDYLVNEEDPVKRKHAIRRAIGAEKGKLITHLPENGLAILNTDDDVVIRFRDRTIAPLLTFGVAHESDLRIGRLQHSLSGTKFTFHYQAQSAILQLKQNLLPSHYTHTFAAALCIAIDEGMSLEQGIALIKKNYRLPPGRSSLIPGIKGSLIIDSSYNASARPTIDFLEMIESLNSPTTYCILGDMRELGKEARHEHELVAQKAARVCDQVFLIGPAMKKYALPLMNQTSPHKARWFDSGIKAAETMGPMLKPADIIFIKGSQNTLFLETAVEALMRNPDKANDLLCRRGSFWDQRRARAGLSLNLPR